MNLPAHIPIAKAPLPTSYDTAKQALASCASVDECKDWADKAQALASYARQADDDSLLKLATRIQARAIRRAGELLKEFQTSPRGGRPAGNGGSAPTVSQRQAAAAAGMSKDQEVTAVRVANVPQQDFDAAVEGDDPPTVTALAEIGKQTRPVPQGFQEATHLIGALRDFARFCSEHPPELVAGGVMPSETPEVRQQVAAIDGWLDRFVVALED